MSFSIELLYDLIIGEIWGIFIIVSLILIISLSITNTWRVPTDRDIVERVSILIPLFLLVNIGVATFSSLYIENKSIKESIFLKVIGSQWIWTYEYCDYSLETESFLAINSDLEIGAPSLLYCSAPCIVPINTNIIFKLGSRDVLHAWTIPCISIKSDCVPGIIFNISTIFTIAGNYFGICRELCGANHSLIAIHVQAVAPIQFITWIKLSLSQL